MAGGPMAGDWIETIDGLIERDTGTVEMDGTNRRMERVTAISALYIFEIANCFHTIHCYF